MADSGIGVRHHLIVHIAVTPLLCRLIGLDHGVPCFPVVRSGVLVLRGVAASDMTTRQAQPQIDPGVSHLDTLQARIGRVGFDLSQLSDMSAVPFSSK